MCIYSQHFMRQITVASILDRMRLRAATHLALLAAARAPTPSNGGAQVIFYHKAKLGIKNPRAVINSRIPLSGSV